MVHVLGVPLPDHQVAKYALTHFYGIGRHTAARICARLQIHDSCRVRNLTPTQVTALASFLSAPSTAPPSPRYPLAAPSFTAPSPATPPSALQAALAKAGGVVSLAPAGRVKYSPRGGGDPLRNLRIESELRREVRENIAHQRMIGSYVGKRHAMGLTVRGQNTQNNAKTARKLNRIERYA